MHRRRRRSRRRSLSRLGAIVVVALVVAVSAGWGLRAVPTAAEPSNELVLASLPEIGSPVVVSHPSVDEVLATAAAEEERREQARARARAKAKAEAEAAARAEAQRRAALAEAARSIERAIADPKSAAQGLMLDYDWGDDQFACLDKLWTRESRWRYTAENPSSGAYGIPQALPASKMARFGDDYRTNPITQITWGLWYIEDRYGTPCQAWAHSQATGWY